MKYMKLGSKPDAFHGDGSGVRYVSSELPTDLIVNVDGEKFHLHKFPLLSKSSLLHKLIVKASEEGTNEILINDFPGGPKAFEICAKFCYGMIVTLNANNVVAARCAAEYLQMTEDTDRGNLIFKIEVFLNSSVFRSWKDSIIVLQTTKNLLPWSEDLKVVGRCIDSIAAKTSVDPSNVNWSYTCNRKLAFSHQLNDHAMRFQQKLQFTVPKDWWIEDICELDVDLYKRVMVAVKAKGRMSADVIGEALKSYAVRWLPESVDDLVSEGYARRNRLLVENIIWLLPSEKGVSCLCSFLLKLLKVVILIGAEDSLTEELLNRTSPELDKASVKDLLIPARPPGDTIYDVNLVQSLVSKFIVEYESTWGSDIVVKSEKLADGFVLGHTSLLSVGKLVDGYLAEIACDPNLPLPSFIDLSRLIPNAARPIHDALYTAIDVYLKEHPDLSKAERKRICGLMDVKKLSQEACVHAAQNDRLPLRMVVQVLFFEQVRATAWSLSASSNDITHGSIRKVEEECKSLNKQLKTIKIMENECPMSEEKSNKISKNRGGAFLLQSRSRRILDKLWIGKAQVGNKSSETSGSSQSPPTSVNPVEVKSSGSSSRNRRHSIS